MAGECPKHRCRTAFAACERGLSGVDATWAAGKMCGFPQDRCEGPRGRIIAQQSTPTSGRSSAWLERYVRDVEVASSNLVAPTLRK